MQPPDGRRTQDLRPRVWAQGAVAAGPGECLAVVEERTPFALVPGLELLHGDEAYELKAVRAQQGQNAARSSLALAEAHALICSRVEV